MLSYQQTDMFSQPPPPEGSRLPQAPSRKRGDQTFKTTQITSNPSPNTFFVSLCRSCLTSTIPGLGHSYCPSCQDWISTSKTVQIHSAEDLLEVAIIFMAEGLEAKLILVLLASGIFNCFFLLKFTEIGFPRDRLSQCLVVQLILRPPRLQHQRFDQGHREGRDHFRREGLAQLSQ